MDFKSSQTGARRILFDVGKDGSKLAAKHVLPEEEQEANESRRLWSDLTDAIIAKDMDAATEAKSSVEEAQRQLRRQREESGQIHVPRFFELRDGCWVPKLVIPQEPTQEAVDAVEKWIWSSP